MPRFYISDSAQPGRRVPLAEYRKSDGTRQSDILNEAQAIARRRKLVATDGGAPALPAILADMSAYNGGLGGTMGGLALSSFPSFFAALNAGEYAGAWTIAIRTGEDVDGYFGFQRGNAQSSLFLYDNEGSEGCMANGDDMVYENLIDAARGAFFFFSTTTDNLKYGAGNTSSGFPIPASGVLPGYPASDGSLVYESTGSDTASAVFAWPRALTPTQMTEAVVLYAP